MKYIGHTKYNRRLMMVYSMILNRYLILFEYVSVHINITTNDFLCARLKSKCNSRAVKDAKADFD